MGTKLVNRLRKLAPICRGQAEIYIEKAAYEIDRLEAENAALREDAERYRWLADKTLACDYGDNEKGSIGWNIGHFKGPRWIAGLSIDAAIDAAKEKA